MCLDCFPNSSEPELWFSVWPCRGRVYWHVCMQNEFVGSFKHAARREMSEADVNGSMYVQFEDNSNVISTARIAVGGILSTAATVYDLTQPLTGRSVSTQHS